jgi:hypothetical protein
VGLPTRGTVTLETYYSLTQNMGGFNSVLIPVARKSVDEARNEIAETMLHVRHAQLPFSADLCLWTDDDAWWGPFAIQTAIQTFADNPHIDILCGYYCSRAEYAPPMAFFRVLGDGVVKPGRGPLIEITRCGFHWVMMRKEALRAVGENPFSVIDGDRYEDVSFCHRAKSVGLRIFCSLDIAIGHVDAATGFVYFPYMPKFESNGSGPVLTDFKPTASVSVPELSRSYGEAIDKSIVTERSSAAEVGTYLKSLMRVPE